MTKEETPQQAQIADYNAYLQLKQLNYTNEAIADHLSYSKENLGYLISRYGFVNSLEYKLQEQEGEYSFNGAFYITSGIKNLLTVDEIKEIYDFVQELVKRHKGIDYLQTFYHPEHDCKLFFIDQVNKPMLDSHKYSSDDNHCTLMLSTEY